MSSKLWGKADLGRQSSCLSRVFCRLGGRGGIAVPGLGGCSTGNLLQLLLFVLMQGFTTWLHQSVGCSHRPSCLRVGPLPSLLHTWPYLAPCKFCLTGKLLSSNQPPSPSPPSSPSPSPFHFHIHVHVHVHLCLIILLPHGFSV